MDMKHCLLRRLLGLVPLLLGISFLSFVLIQLSPGDPAEVAIRVNDITPTPELLAEMRAQLGLDRPSRSATCAGSRMCSGAIWARAM